MGNPLGIDLGNKVVIFKKEHMKVDPTQHPYLVKNGFGSLPNTTGSSLSGQFLSDGEEARMDAYMIDRLATQEEVVAALAIRGLIDDPSSPFYGLVQPEAKTNGSGWIEAAAKKGKR